MLAGINFNKICRFVIMTIIMTNIGACSEDMSIFHTDSEPTGAVLRLTTVGNITRANDNNQGDNHYAADEYSEDSNEEKIERVSLFFFSEEHSTEQPFYTYEVTLSNQITIADINVKIPIDKIAYFQNKKAYVYALVNLPKQISVDADKNLINGKAATLTNLKSIWVDAPEFVSAGVPATFVMRGGEEVNIVEQEGKLAFVTGTIMLERLASKIRLWADIPNEIYVDKETGRSINREDYDTEEKWEEAKNKAERWKPITETEVNGNITHNVKLYLYNLTTHGRVDGYVGTTDEKPDLGYESVDRRKERADAVRLLLTDAKLTAADKNDKYKYSHSVAYYSYPNEWDSTSPSEKHQTYVILALPWKNVTESEVGSEFDYYYYQIPINAVKGTISKAEADRLTPNYYYRTKVYLGMLGSKNIGDPLPVDASYEVVRWQNVDVDVNIKDRRYLVVNQKEWVMNNESSIKIPFSSSHKVVIDKCYVTYFRYYEPWGTDENSKEPENENSYDPVDGTITSWKKNSNQPNDFTLTHNMKEFDVWLTTAENILNGGKEGEGLISADFDEKTGNVLYYKKKYFYDDIYAQRADGKGGYKYYVGHEQPKTFHYDFISFRETQKNIDNAKDRETWNTYCMRYSTDSIYTYTVDNDNGIIVFSHPLIQWKEVRTNNDGTGSLKYYVPELKRDNFCDEFSRCEIVIKIKHADWSNNDDLYRETIYITQYPAVYVEVSHNYGNVCTFDENGSYGNEYLRVNGNAIEDVPSFTGRGSSSYITEWYETGRWMEYFGTVNNNPNMYVIHSTQLSEENEILYDLGDPRTLYYNNMLDDETMDKYTKENSAINSIPQRWSNDDITPGGASLGYTLPQINANNLGPAWWTLREWRSLTGRLYFHYLRYDLCKSLYPDFKPNNKNGNPSKDYFGAPPEYTYEWNYYINNKNNLCYYYPTDESTGAGTKENFIAPVFRIASSFGKVTLDTGNKVQARRRCATYQESGRPAGRWRLPTKAEVEYMVQLSNDLKIPILFGYPYASSGYGTAAYYWTANGSIGVNVVKEEGTQNYSTTTVPGVEASTNAVRCVYDDWYWTQVDGKELPTPKRVLETDFYWGDRPKDNTQTQSLIRRLKK